MTPKLAKSIGVTALLAVAVVPLAAAAASNGHPVATAKEAAERGLARSAHAVSAAKQPASIILGETIVSARVRTPAEREAAAITAEECPSWRLLVTDAESSTSDPSRVRICDVPIQDDELVADRAVTQSDARPMRSVMVFDYGVAEPAAGP